MRMKSGDSTWGVSREEYDKRASAHSRASIILWVLGGLGYNLWVGHLVSWSSVLLILPGIFVASFASMPTLWVEIKKQKIIQDTNNVLVLLAFTVWALIDLLYPIVLGILFVYLITLI